MPEIEGRTTVVVTLLELSAALASFSALKILASFVSVALFASAELTVAL